MLRMKIKRMKCGRKFLIEVWVLIKSPDLRRIEVTQQIIWWESASQLTSADSG